MVDDATMAATPWDWLPASCRTIQSERNDRQRTLISRQGGRATGVLAGWRRRDVVDSQLVAASGRDAIRDPEGWSFLRMAGGRHGRRTRDRKAWDEDA
nr:unnamed protein product [Digitaria exilis]